MRLLFNFPVRPVPTNLRLGYYNHAFFCLRTKRYFNHGITDIFGTREKLLGLISVNHQKFPLCMQQLMYD